MFRFALLVAGVVSCMAAAAVAEGRNAGRVAREVDRLLAEELFTDSVELAPQTDDATFLRRVWLDLVGDIPSPEHVTAFLLDPSDSKRDRVIRDLLASEQYGQNWARYWRDVIMYRRIEDRAVIASNAVVTLLTDELNAGTGWDEVATRFITSSGDVQDNGATAIMMAQDGRTEETTAEISRIFLGIQIQCAQCHDHPYDRWKREQFHELAAFFPRTAVRPVNSTTRRSFEVVSNDSPANNRRGGDNANRRGTPEHYMPDLDDPAAEGTRMEPKFFLTGAEVPLGTRDAERRERIAEWMTDSEWFAKAYVNRMWAELVGEGFYEPVDDIGPDRTPSGGKAMEYLSEEFAASGYNPKWLMRVILSTEAYQRETRPRRLPDAVPFTANVAQPLRGDQLFNSLLTTLELDEATIRSMVSANGRAYGVQSTPRLAFDVAFGFDPSEPRETVTSSIPQALAMMNTPQINAAVSAGRRLRPTSLGKLLRDEEDDELVTSELFLRTLCREPTTEELAQVSAYQQSVGDRTETYEDLLWSLINSTEYAYRK
ncbi:DUF1549 domain-containing protein [Aeoliella mucimassa]|uniref:Planctomycete cytochrome C n=1 Tax=Aeoliella mucimassa TaxID=2527972 RepID=A0A518AVU3_9BACT|nr:DUF1549 domain-containing protein [Aeoliella mucimassa]QDU58845.1 hypothetical protein Pan181_50850 [Aeoliella mucimassa]